VQKKIHNHLWLKQTSVSRWCNFIYRIYPSLFLKTLQKRDQAVRWAGDVGGAINASNARAHERPEGSLRFQNARVYARSSANAGLLWLLYEHRGYCYRYASCQPPLLPLLVFTRTCNPGLRPYASEQASEWTSRVKYSCDIDIVDVFLQPQAIR